MGFWGTMGKIFDPKNIGTAAGFALGGPLGAAGGAALGRTVGGIIPGFGGRKSSLEGKGDLGRMLRDAATGYAAGTVASKVPGIKNLEGAFAGGGAAPGAGVMPMTGGPGGLSEAAQGAWNQQLGSGAGQLGAGGAAGAVNPYTGGAGAQQMAFQAPNQSIMTSPYAAATEGLGAPSMGAENLMQTATGSGGPLDISGTTAKLATTAQDMTSQFNMSAMGGTGPTAGMHAAMPRAGMSGLEKAMLLQTGIGAIGELGGGIYDEIRGGRDRQMASAVFGDEYLRSMGADPARAGILQDDGSYAYALGHRGGTPTGYKPQSYRAWAG